MNKQLQPDESALNQPNPDTTEPNQAQAVQRLVEEKYRRLFETIKIGFALCQAIRDKAGKVIDYDAGAGWL